MAASPYIQNVAANLPNEDQIDVQQLLRQRALADRLVQASQQPRGAGQMVGDRFVPTPWTQSLADAVGEGLGAYMHRRADEREKELGQERVAKRLASFQALHGLESQGGDSVVETGAPATPYAGAFDPKTRDPLSLNPNGPPVTVRGRNAALTPEQRIAQRIAETSAATGQDPYALMAGDPFVQAEIAALKTMQTPQKLGPGDILAIPGQTPLLSNPKAQELKTVEVQARDKNGKPLYDANNDPVLEVRTFNPATGQIGEVALGTRPGNTGTKVTQVNGQKDNFENERKLRNDFKSEPVYKAFQEVRSAYAQIQSGINAGTPIGDVAAATKIMKLLDPGSVVRESELGIALNSKGLLDKVTNFANSIVTGRKLTPAQRQEFRALADEFYKQSEAQYDAKAAEYGSIAKDYGLNADRVRGATPQGGDNSGWKVQR